MAEFLSETTAICTVCHLGAEPWRPLHFDRPPRPDTEFGVRFSHGAHLREHGLERDCAACHRQRLGDREMRLSMDHDSCRGRGCHGGEDTKAPVLAQCSSCHVAGLVASRQNQRQRARWTVRTRFRHAPHTRDPRFNAAVACTTCHQGLERAARIDDIPTPPKSTCEPCHDGTVAFKVTGHGCTRCHEKRARQ